MKLLCMTLKSESGVQREHLEVLGPVFFEERAYGSWRYVTRSEYMQLFVEDAKRRSYVNSPRSSQELWYIIRRKFASA